MKRPYNLKYKIKSEINIVPFLDVLLVLLIVFMMIPSKLLIQKGFEVHLPNSNVTTEIFKNNKFLITIEILGSGMFNLMINNQRIQHIPSNKLIAELHTIMTTHSDIVCLIAASKEEKYQEITQVLETLKNIGINSIGMITNSYKYNN